MLLKKIKKLGSSSSLKDSKKTGLSEAISELDSDDLHRIMEAKNNSKKDLSGSINIAAQNVSSVVGKQNEVDFNVNNKNIKKEKVKPTPNI